MRAALLAMLAFGTFAAFDATPAAAAYGSAPFCMRTYFDDDDCSYATYQQCATTASGLGTTCFANPAVAYRQQRYRDQPVPPRRPRSRAPY